ncbi:MAG: AAA domain-containing protein [Gammaproteobacteria bacterium]|nr:AAA domain-containing protein [Gammaproteobacteria bacterium]
MYPYTTFDDSSAKVGTVDKFQGQEAPIVLVSMVTSSAHDLPRNIEFLYSKNRLNVAVSRAQCLAVVFLNENLLDVPCKTVEQMKLINTFCWLYEFSIMENFVINSERKIVEECV